MNVVATAVLLLMLPLVGGAHEIQWDEDDSYPPGTTFELVINNGDVVPVEGHSYKIPEPHTDQLMVVDVRAVAPPDFDCGEPPADGSEPKCPRSDWATITRYIPGAQTSITVNYEAHPGPLNSFFSRYPFDEGEGKIAKDVGSSGLHGVLTRNPTYKPDTPDKSPFHISFNGDQQRVEIDGLDISGNQFSVSVWFRIEEFRQVDDRIISQATDTREDNHTFMLSLTQVGNYQRLRGRLRLGDQTQTLVATRGNIARGIWYHAVMSYDGAFIRLFLNGIEVGSVTTGGRVQGNRLLLTGIGCQPTDAGDEGRNDELRCMNGDVDDIRLFHSALHVQEIKDYLNQFSPPGLIAAYGFEETDSNVIVDAMGNFHGTAVKSSRAAGKYGNAIKFTGQSGQMGVIPYDPALNPKEITYSAWVKPTEWIEWSCILLNEKAGQYEYALYFKNREPVATFGVVPEGYQDIYSGRNVSRGNWVHLAVTNDDQEMILYINGEMNKSLTVQEPKIGGQRGLFIGGNNIWANENIKGLIDEVRIYNRILTQAEIQEDMGRPIN